MVQPFTAVKSPCKNNGADSPVCKHADPDFHRSKSKASDKKYAQTESACPHGTAGCDHGKSYITGCTKSISRNKCHCPHKRFYNRDPHYHMETHICTLFLHTAKNGNRLRQCKYHKAAYQYYDFCNHTIEIMEISIGPLVLSCARKIDAAESYAAINGNDRAV